MSLPGSALVALAAVLGLRQWHGRWLIRQALARLDHVGEADAAGLYAVARPRSYAGQGRQPAAVLLLHGFTASPDEFARLLEALEREGRPYAAPLLTGFGTRAIHLLEAVEADDWVRDALQAYDSLAASAEAVDVVGSSMGALLAVEVARQRPVRDLVLVSPFSRILGGRERLACRASQHAAARTLLRWLYPVVWKPVRAGRVTNVDIVDPEGARRAFHLAAVPAQALFAVWALQRRHVPVDVPCRRLTVLYGKADQTSDMPGLLAVLAASGTPHVARAFARSGHGLLEDHDGQAAVEAVMEALGPA